MKLTTYSVASLLAVALLFTACDKKNTPTPKVGDKTTNTKNQGDQKPGESKPADQNNDNSSTKNQGDQKPGENKPADQNNDNSNNSNKGNQNNNTGENTGNNGNNVQGDQPIVNEPPKTPEVKKDTDKGQTENQNDLTKKVSERLVGKSFTVTKVKFNGLLPFTIDSELGTVSEELKQDLLAGWTNIDKIKGIKQPIPKEFSFTDDKKGTLTDTSSKSTPFNYSLTGDEEGKNITLTITTTGTSTADTYSVETKENHIELTKKFSDAVDVTYYLKQKDTEPKQ